MKEAFTLHHGDSLDVLKTLPDNFVDAIVCDPPAGIAFMNAKWDSDKGGRDAWIAWLASIMSEALRVLKPGGHALVWALPRTSHWTGMAVEDAGFELRDRISHLFGSGFPKSLSVSAAIDKAAGAEREVLGKRKRQGGPTGMTSAAGWNAGPMANDDSMVAITAPATESARQWQGWGTAMKPAMEDWWLARKPLSEKTVAANVLRWGTGALNIDGCRIGTGNDRTSGGAPTKNKDGSHSIGGGWANDRERATGGRWPANLTHDGSDEVLAGFPHSSSGAVKAGTVGGNSKNREVFGEHAGYAMPAIESSTGSAARFFKQASYDDEDIATIQRFMYCPKASKRDRDEGLEGFDKSLRNREDYRREINTSSGKPRGDIPRANVHPTVKPTPLMAWLVRMVTPPGGVVIDPFMGSGSTGKACALEGFRFIGIEREAEYIAIAQARIEAAHKHATEAAARAQEPVAQPELFGKLA